jgi:predicted 3-demethylubiquinone-9 3-methyltransferase (glyoxalase superfamily)
MPELTTFLWYDNEAEDAARFYTSLFDDGNVLGVRRYGSAGPGEAGTVMTVDFELAGHRLVALNGGDAYRFNEAVSLMIRCDDQDQVDHLWSSLTDGGEPGPCGWLKDRYGVSWQIVPKLMFRLLDDPDPVKAQAAMAAMLQMGKIESAGIQAAYDDA